VRAAKKLYFESQLKNAQSNLKKTWSILKNAINQTPNKSSSISRLLVGNAEITDPCLIAESFNEFFINAARLIVEEIPPTDRPPDPVLNDDIPLFSLSDSPVTRTEISEVIKSLKDKYTQDFCGLSTHFIKSVSDQILTPLHHLINASFSFSVFPSQLKIAKVIPLLKQGSPTSMDNYRPISLLSCFSKIFEKIVCNRLCNFLDRNNLISPSQFGFRSEHSLYIL
jgi:Notch-like protein